MLQRDKVSKSSESCWQEHVHLEHASRVGVLSGRVFDVRPQASVIVCSDFVEVGRDVEAVGLSGSKCLGKTEEAGSERADTFGVQDLRSNHSRSDGGDLDAELVSAHSDLLELLGVGAGMLEDGEGVVGECRRDLDEDTASDQGNELGSELGALWC